jgi:hypothetical protein
MELTIEQIHEKYKPRGDFEAFEVLATDMGGEFPILVRYKNKQFGEWFKTSQLYMDGSVFESLQDNDYDLIPKEERVQGWVNVYKDEAGELEFSFKPYPSHDEAFNGRKQIGPYFATIHIDCTRESK